MDETDAKAPRRLTFNGPGNDVVDPVTGTRFVPGEPHNVTLADVERLISAFPTEYWYVEGPEAVASSAGMPVGKPATGPTTNSAIWSDAGVAPGTAPGAAQAPTEPRAVQELGQHVTLPETEEAK